MVKGILIKAIAGFYYVKAGNTVYECKARGHFKKQGISPLPGDNVIIDTIGENSGVINEILPRKNSFLRPTVANVDKLFIISSYSTPAPNTYIIDLMIALAKSKNIEPIVVFNKCDMGNFDEYEQIYKSAGIKVFTVSALTKQGTDKLFRETKGNISVFTGNSGVGKTSLLNLMFPDLKLETGEVSQKLGRGRHTTREVTLFYMENGGYIVDTPGFSALDLKKGEKLDMEQLQYLFAEFEPFLDKCRFSSCTHTVENGCAVIDAVANGQIHKSRFESYRLIYSELKEIFDNRYSK